LNYQRGRLAKAQADLDRIAKQVAESEEELGQLDTQLITLQAQAVDIPQ
jgi:predicted  nucleic acid-binding Zn-ribbon protein